MNLLLSVLLLLVSSPALASSVPYKPTGWHECGRRLVEMAKRPEREHLLIPSLFSTHSAVKQGDFLSYLLSIAYVESRFNSEARSPMGAVGLLQITGVGAIDAAKECLIPSVRLDKLYVPAWNVLYSSCLLRKYLRETGGSWFHTLILYNGGYRQLTRFLSTGTLAPETRDYVLQVMNVHGLCLAR